MSITVCLLNWRRVDNLHRIIDRLAEQTARPRVFLWNNAAEPFQHEAVDWRADSTRNVLCPPRWWMASMAETEFVMSLDDDLLPADADVIRDAVAVAANQPADRVIGPYGTNLHPGEDYFPHDDVHQPQVDTMVDLLKGRCMLLRTAILREALRLGDLISDLGAEEDIAVCGALAAGRRKYHLVPGVFHGRFRELPAGDEALKRRPDHPELRNAARRRWFPDPRKEV